MTVLNELFQHKIVAIVRGIPGSAADATASALVEGGIRMLEVTMNTTGALDMLAAWRRRYGNQVRIGAGTVLDVEAAKQAVSAGAEFIISPNVDEAVMAYAIEQGIDVWPGAMTPTEIVRAWKAGAKAVKLFPMGTLGVGYLKEIRAPLNQIPLIATGGVTVDNVSTVLEAGASAVGVGGNLVNKKLIEAGDFKAIAALASQFAAAVASSSST